MKLQRMLIIETLSRFLVFEMHNYSNWMLPIENTSFAVFQILVEDESTCKPLAHLL